MPILFDQPHAAIAIASRLKEVAPVISAGGTIRDLAMSESLNLAHETAGE